MAMEGRPGKRGEKGRILLAGPPPKLSLIVEDVSTGQSVDENLKMRWEKLSSVNLCSKDGMGRNEQKK